MEQMELNIEDFKFQGIARKIKLVSNKLCYGPAPKKGAEIEQRLTINSKGNVWLSRYGYGKGCKREKLRDEKFSISIEQANYILAAVGLSFSRNTIPPMDRDVGDWKLEITDLDGNVKEFICSLGSENDPENLSGLIRRELGRKDLFLFDGKAKFQ